MRVKTTTAISHWLRSNVLGVVAIFIALSGTAYATHPGGADTIDSADIINNSVKAADIRNDLLSGGGLVAADLRPDSVGTSEVDGSLTNADIADTNSLGDPEIDQETLGLAPQAFARVQADASLQGNTTGFPPQAEGIDPGDVVKGESAAATGTYCFGGLGFRAASALVTLDNADALAADRNLVASVAIDRGEDLGECPGTHNNARVRIVDGNTGAAQDARFYIWFLR